MAANFPSALRHEAPPAQPLTLLSLLLCLAAVAMWVRGYFAADTLHFVHVPDKQRHGVVFFAHSNRGMATLVRYDLRSAAASKCRKCRRIPVPLARGTSLAADLAAAAPTLAEAGFM